MAKPNDKGGKNDQIAPPAGAIVGTSGDDVISQSTFPAFSTDSDDVIWGLEGADEIYGGAGNDTIVGGSGDDVLYGDTGDDVINGGDGSDIIYGGAGSDIIDGGDDGGIDVVMYDGVEGEDYDVVILTALVGKGRNQREVVTGFEVYALDGSGDVDYLTSIEQVLFVQYPEPGTVITESDFAFTQFDTSVEIDVLANDYLEGANQGDGIEISEILDAQIDLDNDGVNDLDLIPDGVDLGYFVGGGLLNDGSILTLTANDTLVWDPNGVYDTAPGVGEEAPSIYFWYAAADGSGGVEYGDVSLQVTYPSAPSDIQFEDMVGVYDEFTADLLGLHIYQDGPNGAYWVSQLTSATNYFEKRDVSVTDFDYDGDGDDEFRIWTEADGTTHEMNITHSEGQKFDLGGMYFIGLDSDETATLVFSDGEGNAIGQVTVVSSDLDADGRLEITNASNIDQFNVVAGIGDDFYVDDVFIF